MANHPNRSRNKRVRELEAALRPFAEFARGHRAQREGPRTTTPKTGELYGIGNRLGEFRITVEDLEAALACFERSADEPSQ